MTIYFYQHDLELDSQIKEVTLENFLKHSNPRIVQACYIADKIVYEDEKENSKVLKSREPDDFEIDSWKFNSMNIYAKEGAKVVCKTLRGGYTNHVANKYLEIGKQYTVEKTVVHNWRTEVFLKEFPGIAFNSVYFKDFKKN
jgi:hypothetical protein